MKAQDPKAEAITFGVELETTIPITSGVVVGAYHVGTTVRSGADAQTNMLLTAPTYQGQHWKAERDGSIMTRLDRLACEFVSPILSGSQGVEHLIQFAEWARAIGANVNASCGCHITVGVKSIIGTDDPQAMSVSTRGQVPDLLRLDEARPRIPRHHEPRPRQPDRTLPNSVPISQAPPPEKRGSRGIPREAVARPITITITRQIAEGSKCNVRAALADLEMWLG